MTTRTSRFSIGFRRGGSAWQKDLKTLAAWAKTSGFAAIDLGRLTAADAAIVKDAGLRLGSVDLFDFGQLCAADPGKRKDVIDANVAYIRDAAAAGAKLFFTVIIPGDASKPRGENYAAAVESYTPIAKAIESAGGKLVIEGWPGPGPHYPSLCCTPETYRSFIRDIPHKSVGINYDPSHLVRLGVDHIRFLDEFADHVHHVHAKDTELIPEAVYEYGLYQGSAFTKPHGFGEQTWRYTIPGHGQVRWPEVFALLHRRGYKGIVSIELEDENFNGSEDGERAGLLHSLAFLKGA